MPLVVLEAMGTGLPIIASRVQGTDELVTENVNGALFDPGDVDGLATVLSNSLTQGKRALRWEKRIEKRLNLTIGKTSLTHISPFMKIF